MSLPSFNQVFGGSLLSFPPLALPPPRHHLLPLPILSPAPAILNCSSYAISWASQVVLVVKNCMHAISHLLFPLPGKPFLLHSPLELRLRI